MLLPTLLARYDSLVRRLALGCVVCVAFAVSGFACKKGDDDKPKKSKKVKKTKDEDKQAKTPKPDDKSKKPDDNKVEAPAAGSIEIRSADGKTAMFLEPAKKSKGGFRIKDAAGKKLGRVKLDDTKVKVRDAKGDTTKAKKKHDGFKVYKGEDVVLRVKKRGENKFKLKGGDDADMGKLKGNRLTLKSGDEIVVETVGDTISVMRAGKALFTVKNLKPEHAVYLGVTELSLHQRIAAVIAASRF